MKSPLFGIILVLCSVLCPAQRTTRSLQYAALQKHLAQGWNTWDNHSTLTQVLLPQGLSISLGILDDPGISGTNSYLENALIGRRGEDAEQVIPGSHAYDGSYSDLTLIFHHNRLRVQSATIGDDLVVLVTPIHTSALPPIAVFRSGMLWNRPGKVSSAVDHISADLPRSKLLIYPTSVAPPDIPPVTDEPFIAERLSGPVGISTGRKRSVREIVAVIDTRRPQYAASLKQYGGKSEIVDAMQTVLAWDTIYDPAHDRVITPVSRIWDEQWGGYVLFDWDTFFAAEMAGFNNRDLAYANAIEILNEATSAGFIPNFARAGDRRSEDRSEPPVGSMVVLDLYHRYHDRWFLEETFPALLRWNRWWAKNRDRGGYLVWGSDAYNAPWAKGDLSIHTLQGARFESGLDNSPMYDDATFDPSASQMELADVGLMSMYIYDCNALAKIASALGNLESRPN